jgi:hypothetical protein
MSERLVCWNCGGSLDDTPRPISRHVNCPACFEVLHCCRMCRHYEQDKRPYCDHDRADPPVEKANANFCDYFKPTNRFDVSSNSKSDNARSELDSLFDNSSPNSSEVDPDQKDEEDPLNKLNDLFND